MSVMCVLACMRTRKGGWGGKGPEERRDRADKETETNRQTGLCYAAELIMLKSTQSNEPINWQ
jgi:hypothetical protein